MIPELSACIGIIESTETPAWQKRSAINLIERQLSYLTPVERIRFEQARDRFLKTLHGAG
jgi:hypothetical protein